jgi:drug/metabolite transporter (DMT)-like permease
MSRRHTIMLFALAAIWGASFMFIKVAVRELEPFALVWLRLTLAAIVLVPIALISLGRAALAEFRAAYGRLAVLGIANSALPFTLLSWAEIRLDSGVAAILQGSAPLFTALISVRYGNDRVAGLRLVGVLLGFVGVALLVGAHSGNDLGAALAVVGMALCYSASGIFGSQRLRDTSPLVVAAGSMLIGSLATLPFGLASLPSHMIGAEELGSILVLGIVGTGLAYILFYAILRGAGASRSILVTYLVPGAAVAYGAVFLGEPLRATALVGLVLILGGVALGSRRRPAASPA